MTFQARLKKCMATGNLTVADLSRWFDRPHATLRCWVEDGAEPGGGPVDKEHAAQLLGLLETLIKKKQGFPVPRLGPKARIKHVMEIRRVMLP